MEWRRFVTYLWNDPRIWGGAGLHLPFPLWREVLGNYKICQKILVLWCTMSHKHK